MVLTTHLLAGPGRALCVGGHPCGFAELQAPQGYTVKMKVKHILLKNIHFKSDTKHLRVKDFK